MADKKMKTFAKWQIVISEYFFLFYLMKIA